MLVLGFLEDGEFEVGNGTKVMKWRIDRRKIKIGAKKNKSVAGWNKYIYIYMDECGCSCTWVLVHLPPSF